MAKFLMDDLPRYAVLRRDGFPDCVKREGGKAVCIFADEDLAERYCKAKSRAIQEQLGKEVREFDLLVFERAEALLASLHKNLGAFAERGIHFVAVNPMADPSAMKRSIRIALPEFLNDLEEEV